MRPSTGWSTAVFLLLALLAHHAQADLLATRDCTSASDCFGLFINSACVTCDNGKCAATLLTCAMMNGQNSVTGVCTSEGWCQISCDINNPCPSCYTCSSTSTTAGACNLVTCSTGCCNTNTGVCDSALRCDPILTGFDGKEFHFNQVGDFILLEEGDGWKVESTFTGETVTDDFELMEKSWTTSVRVISPNGDKISMLLPKIKPSTTQAEVVAMAADGTAEVHLSSAQPTIAFEHMSAKIVASEEKGVWACLIKTPKMSVTITRTTGWEQAQIDPTMESWATPFTWLNVNFKLNTLLAGPVTGILGATYPPQLALGEDDLQPLSVVASVAGDTVTTRSLTASLDANGDRPISMTAGIEGLAPVWS